MYIAIAPAPSLQRKADTKAPFFVLCACWARVARPAPGVSRVSGSVGVKRGPPRIANIAGRSNRSVYIIGRGHAVGMLQVSYTTISPPPRGATQFALGCFLFATWRSHPAQKAQAVTRTTTSKKEQATPTTDRTHTHMLSSFQINTV